MAQESHRVVRLELVLPALLGLGLVASLLAGLETRLLQTLASLTTLCVAVSLVAASSRLAPGRRVATRWLAALVGLLAAVQIWTLSANWQLYRGYALEDQGKTDEAVIALEAALTRMDAPAAFTIGRYRLTAVGPVFESRVTPLIAIARIKYEAGDKSAAIASLEAAKAAGIADLREEADLEFLDKMIEKIRAQDSSD